MTRIKNIEKKRLLPCKIKKKIWILISLLIIPILSLISCSSGLNLNLKKKKVDPMTLGIVRDGVYVNNYYGCAFQIPGKWSYTFPENEEDFVYFYNNDKSNEIRFKVVKLDEKTTLFDFVGNENNLHRELTQIKERKINVKGIPSTDADYIQILQTETLKLKKIYFIKGYKGFVFTLISKQNMYKNGYARLYAMTNSFRFTEKEEDVDSIVESIKNPSPEFNVKRTEKEKTTANRKISNESSYIIHIVKKGENLSSIAEYYTGNPSNNIIIARFNGLKYPYLIKIKDRIKIPSSLIKPTIKEEEPQKSMEKEEEVEIEEPIYEPQ